jgi:hypothetical protein
MIRSTYTYAVLVVSPAVYSEIKEKLEKAGYSDQFHNDRDDGPVIDMHGIALSDGGEHLAAIASITPDRIVNRAHLQVLLAQAITARLKEEIVDEIIPKPTVAELEKMMTEAEKEGKEFGRIMPSGDIVRSHTKPVFASDLADAVLSAIQSSGFEIVSSRKEPRTVLDARTMCRPGDEPLA